VISSRGADGIGHQMEAKLSCIATAAALDDVTYTHSPLAVAEHLDEQDSHDNVLGDVEQMFGLGEKFPALSNTTRIVAREPLPWVGKCSETSWFDVRPRGVDCSPEIAYVSDNCWDFFYCALERNEAEVVRPMVDALQKVYGAGDTEQQSKVYGDVVDPDLPLTVAVHIRRTDGRKLSYEHFINVMGHLRDVTADVRFVVHSDEKKNIVFEQIAKPLMKRYHDDERGVEVVIREPRSTTLTQVLQELIGADVLIASMSSLSNTAGLYNLGQRPVLAPYDKERKGLTNLPGWYVLQDTAATESREFYESVVAEARRWKEKRRRKSKL